ncbi:MAG: hypothetical protein PVF73_01055 [Bacteroidales bacterium]
MKTNLKQWLKRIGVIGFLFFFIKGLIWLAIFFGLGKLVFG